MPDPFNPDIPPWKRKNPKATKSRSDLYQGKVGFKGADPIYQDTFPDLARKLCMLNKGITDSDLAKIFEVSPGTIARWKVEHIEFGDAIREGKLICDTDIVEGLFNRGKGYNWEQKKYESIPDPEDPTNPSKSTLVLTEIVEKHLPPDPQAAMLWLKNRHPKLWRDRQELQVSTKDPKEELAEMLGLTLDQLEEKVLEAQRVLSRGQGVEREIESLGGQEMDQELREESISESIQESIEISDMEEE